MAGTKRRRGSSKSSPRGASASQRSTPDAAVGDAVAKNSDLEVAMETLAFLLHQTQSEQKSLGLLQAFADNPCSLLNSDAEGVHPGSLPDDCGWLVLAVQIMNHLLPLVKNNEDSAPLACLLTAYAHCVGSVLRSDEHKLERATAGSSPSRSILGRCVMTTVAACSTALDRFTQLRPDVDTVGNAEQQVRCQMLCMASSTMASLCHLHAAPKPKSQQVASNETLSWAIPTDTRALANVISSSNTCLSLHENITKCFQHLKSKPHTASSSTAILAVPSTESPQSSNQSPMKETGDSAATAETTASPIAQGSDPPAKRTRRTRAKSFRADGKFNAATKAQFHATEEKFRSMLDVHNIRIDGRSTAKKWPAATLAWMSQGENRIAQILRRLIETQESWFAAFASSGLPVLGQRAILVVCCDLAMLFAEETSSSGKAAGGGVEQYLKAIVGGERITKTKKVDNPAIAEVAMLLICEMVRLEARYRSAIAPSDPIIRNLHTSCGKPDLVAAINAISEGVAGLVKTAQRAVYSESLLNWGAAWVLSSTATSKTHVNPELLSFALDHLETSIMLLESSKAPSAKKGQRNLIEELRLNTPLQVPSPSVVVASPGKKSKTAKRTRKQSKTDVVADRVSLFAAQDSLRRESHFALFIRAFATETSRNIAPAPATPTKTKTKAKGKGKGKVKAEPPMADSEARSADDAIIAMYSTILGVIESASGYNGALSFSSDNALSDGDGASIAAKGKAGSPSLRNRKRAKIEQPSSARTAEATLMTMTEQRTQLVTSALNALLDCLMIGSSEESCFRQLMQSAFGLPLVRRFLRFGTHADSVIIRGHLNDRRKAQPGSVDEGRAVGGLKMQAQTATVAVDDGAPGDCISHGIKMVWSMLINICQVLGRGNTATNLIQMVMRTASRTMADDVDTRTAFYSYFIDSDNTAEPPAKRSWGLSLPIPHQVMLLARLSANPISGLLDDIAPEANIIEGYRTKIEGHVSHLLRVPSGDAMMDGGGDDDYNIHESANGSNMTPLSRLDAQIFIMLFLKLPRSDQLVVLREFIESASGSFSHFTAWLEQRQEPVTDGSVASFLSRLLITLATMVDAVAMGDKFRETFANAISGISFSVPSIVPSQASHCSDNRYSSLCGRWDAPWLADVTMSRISISGNIVTAWKDLLQQAFAAGFTTSQSDDCQLLYTSWSMMGKIENQTRKSHTETQLPPAPLRTPFCLKDPSVHILELREDICSIFTMLQRRTTAPSRLKAFIQSLTKNAESMLDSVLKNEERMLQSEQPGLFFSLLSALSVALSAAAAACTTTGSLAGTSTSNSMSAARALLGQAGIFTSETDYGNILDDAEPSQSLSTVDESKPESTRLRAFCGKYGSAPTHPDYLDISCKLREGISKTEAVNIAELALRCQTKLASTAVQQMKQMQKNIIAAASIQAASSGSQDKREDMESVVAALLRWSSDHHPAHPGVPQDWIKLVAECTGLEYDAIRRLPRDREAPDLASIKNNWGQHASQQLRGSLQKLIHQSKEWNVSAAELRACGEWELLLAETLAVSIYGGADPSLAHSSSPNSTMRQTSTKQKQPEKKRARSVARMATGWHVVCTSAVSNLLSASALLRLVLGKVGRRPHPALSMQDSISATDLSQFRQSESFSVAIQVPMSVKLTIPTTCTTLATLCTVLPTTLTPLCHAAASNIFPEWNHFDRIESSSKLASAFDAISWIQSTMPSADSNEAMAKASATLVETLLTVAFRRGLVRSSSSTETDREKYIPRKRLLSCLGTSDGMTVWTIADADTREWTTTLHTLDKLIPAKPSHASGAGRKNEQTSTPLHHSDPVSLLLDIIMSSRSTTTHTSRVLAACMITSCLEEEQANRTVADQGDQAKQSPNGVIPIRLKCLEYLNNIEGSSIEKWLVATICNENQPQQDLDQHHDTSRLRKYMHDVTMLLAMLLVPFPGKPDFQHGNRIASVLLRTMDEWTLTPFAEKRDVASVTFLYCTMYDRIAELFHSFGSLKATLVASKTEPKTRPKVVRMEKMKYLAHALTYFCKLKNTMRHVSTGSVRKNQSRQTIDEAESTGQWPNPSHAPNKSIEDMKRHATSKVPKLCSFKLKKGFHGQHWYNCYTCDLVWDKGCCTLCAVLCHQGHDVSYSRYSSFFCDCGADDGGVLETSRVSCQCLSPVPEGAYKSLFDIGDEDANRAAEPPAIVDHLDAIVGIASMLSKESHSTIDMLLNHIDFEAMKKLVFPIFKEHFQEWQALTPPQQSMSRLGTDVPASVTERSQSAFISLQARVRHSDNTHLTAKLLNPCDFKLLLQVSGFEVDSFRSHASTLSHGKAATPLSAFAFDSRGRMALIGTTSLIFASLSSSVRSNAGGEGTASEKLRRYGETWLRREHVSILGVSQLAFQATSVSICPSNERHLLIWNANSAKCCVIKPGFDGVEATISLKATTADGDILEGTVRQCEWIPQSQSHVVVCLEHALSLFDLRRIDRENNCFPVSQWQGKSTSSLVRIANVPSSHSSDMGVSAQSGQNFSRMYALTNEGALLETVIKVTKDGKLDTELLQTRTEAQLGESMIDKNSMEVELEDASSGSIDAVRGTADGSTAHEGEKKTRCFTLRYLQQSRLLLQEMSDLSMLAHRLSDDGAILDTFEFIPAQVPDEGDGEAKPGEDVTGPFTHWVELGVVKRDELRYFRASCLARTCARKRAVPLVVEFNDREIHMRTIRPAVSDKPHGNQSSHGRDNRSHNNSHIGSGIAVPTLSRDMRRTRNVESLYCLGAFTVPSEKVNASGEATYDDCPVLCGYSADGTLLLFGEQTQHDECDATGLVRRNEDLHPTKRSNLQQVYELTAFERMENISESNMLQFGGHGLGCDPGDLKRRLLARDGSLFLMCPNVNGCTFTISLSTDESAGGRPSKKVGVAKPKLVIGGVRILVGSSSLDSIPRHIIIQGRRIDITPRLKKWYSIPLTVEEIIVGVRTGSVCVTITDAFGSSFESSLSNPVIDALEVCAVGYDSISDFVSTAPADDGQDLAGELIRYDNRRLPSIDLRRDGAGLVSTMWAMAQMTDLCASPPLSLDDHEGFLQELVRKVMLGSDSALQDCTKSLITRSIRDEKRCASFIDEGLLSGCSDVLEGYLASLQQSGGAQVPTQTMQRIVSIAASVARERPMNYLQTTEIIMERHHGRASIANSACKIVDGLARQSKFNAFIDGTRGGVVDLALTELAINLYAETLHTKKFAKFDAIRPLLESEEVSVVAGCCRTISDFCRRGDFHESDSTRPDLFNLLQRTRLVMYRCDSCMLYPIKEVRYCFPEDMLDIDICKTCWASGSQYAKLHNHSKDEPLRVEGRTIQNNGQQLSCFQFQQMRAVSLLRVDVEQVDMEVDDDGDAGDALGDGPGGQAKVPSTRASKPVGTSGKDSKAHRSTKQLGDESYETFTNHLFLLVSEVFSRGVKNHRSAAYSDVVLRLLLDLVRFSRSEHSVLDRAKRLATSIVHTLSYTFMQPTMKNSLNFHEQSQVEIGLRALVNLLKPECDLAFYLRSSIPHEGVETASAPPLTFGSVSTASKASQPRCEDHNHPTIRRKCTYGERKGRSFHVCGMEADQRCKFMQWENEKKTTTSTRLNVTPPLTGAPQRKQPHATSSKAKVALKSHIWTLLSASTPSLHSHLCHLVGLKTPPETERAEAPRSRTVASTAGGTGDSWTSSKDVLCRYGRAQIMEDLASGIFASRQILAGPASMPIRGDECQQSWMDVHAGAKRSESLLRGTLQLITEIASHQTKGMSRWLSLLCSISISTDSPPEVQAAAKHALKKLCGGKKAVFNSVRDHFAFGHLVRKLLSNALPLLNAALVLKEKSRVCRDDFDSTEPVRWEHLTSFGLVGTSQLISESTVHTVDHSKINSLLDSLWTMIKVRPQNWMQFCGLQSLPSTEQIDGGSTTEMEAAAAPLVTLLWIASVLCGTVQTKSFRLIGVAFSSAAAAAADGPKPAKSTSGNQSSVKSPGRKSLAVTSAVATTTTNNNNNTTTETPLSPPLIRSHEQSSPEDIALLGTHKVSSDDIVMFVVEFVLNGKTPELRRAAHTIAARIQRNLDKDRAGAVTTRLFAWLDCVGVHGKASIEFLNLLQVMIKHLGGIHLIVQLASTVSDNMIKQLNCLRYDRGNGAWLVLEGVSNTPSAHMGQGRKKFDLHDCAHCSWHYLSQYTERTNTDPAKEHERPRRSAVRSANDSQVTRVPLLKTLRQSNKEPEWHPSQVSPFTRMRLDSIKSAALSNEFCAFFSLKHRVAMSSLIMNVGNPRGRFVKMVTIYATERPVSKAVQLKSDDYAPQWRKCGVLKFSRGAPQGNVSFDEPVLAANLKIEYTEFYDRPGSSSSKSSEGALVVHCPRCTRIVTNAHGVCGNCGEVAFQCRKCRHINYDRLDAFLCVECGYCASGSFSFEIKAGDASNAIAICTDDDRERMSQLLFGCTSLATKLRSKLKARVTSVASDQPVVRFNPFPDHGKFQSQMVRAFQGLPPRVSPDPKKGDSRDSRGLSIFQKRGAVVRYIASPEKPRRHPGRSSSASSDRTRSVLRLARQIRSQTNSLDRRRSGDVIIHHLGRGLTIEHGDDDNDLLGLLEANMLESTTSRLGQQVEESGFRGVLGIGDDGAEGDLGRSGGTRRGSAGDDQDNPPGSSRISGGRSGARSSSSTPPSNRAGAASQASEECERIHMLMREADRECRELQRRLDAWRILEEGSLYQYDGDRQRVQQQHVEHEIQGTGQAQMGALPAALFTPSHCSVCGPSVAVHLLSVWVTLFSISPSTVQIDPNLLRVLLEDVRSHHPSKQLQEYRLKAVVEIASKSETGAGLVLRKLRELLQATHDPVYAEVLGRILRVKNCVRMKDFEELALDVLANEQAGAGAWRSG